MRNSACRTSICPTRSCMIRCGNAPGTPDAGATAAGCRCRGPATHRRSASPTNPTPGCRCPPEWATLTVEQQLDDPDSTLRSIAGRSNCAASRAEFDGESDRVARLRRRGRWVSAHGGLVVRSTRCPPDATARRGAAWPAPSSDRRPTPTARRGRWLVSCTPPASVRELGSASEVMLVVAAGKIKSTTRIGCQRDLDT